MGPNSSYLTYARRASQAIVHVELILEGPEMQGEPCDYLL
jgi:hypothetical protein